MVQAARNGSQNLWEGSVDSATSKEIEIKFTGTARGTLKELQRDDQKSLQHRNLPEWRPDHPALHWSRFTRRWLKNAPRTSPAGQTGDRRIGMGWNTQGSTNPRIDMDA